MFRFSSQDEHDVINFLRDLVRIPSLSTQEGQVAVRLMEEMRRVGFRDVYADRMGNVIGRIGSGPGPVLVYDGHMDVVGVGDSEAWQRDPFGAEVEEGVMYGRGTVDMKGAIAAMVYGAKALIEANTPLAGSLCVVGVVQEEPSEGLAMRVLVEEAGLRPDFVVLGEPTNLEVSRGQRGRMEMQITVRGRSAHASAPEQGENALHAAARLIFGIELLAPSLLSDPVLGRGTIAVTQVETVACSRNAIPDRAHMIIDRRLTLGETEARALNEIQQIINREGAKAKVAVSEYDVASYTGYRCHCRESYPAWLMPEDHPLLRAAVRASERAIGRRPRLTTWAFSTDGVYTLGQASIPTVGFGPGEERFAHTAEEQIRLADVIKAAKVYAQLAVEVLGTQ
ncbi:MAG: YgeY family selenium metabolism-linked hydrolase [Chloroflexi bacterium]|nr:YgeY family selenium metabolism-linked hydrolase [Chloroflexota bacterium]